MGYPTSVKTFTTRLTGDTIAVGHVNDLQTEVNAIEDGLLNALTHDLTFQDNKKLTLGTGGDADLYYDGTDVILDPAVVGTGRFLIEGSNGATALELKSGTSAMELRMREPSGGGSSYTGFKSPALAANLLYTLPTADGSSGQVLQTNGSLVLSWASAGADLKGIMDGRLTLTSALPVTVADVTAAGTLYYTPDRGDQIYLYDGSGWAAFTFTQRSLSLTLTNGKNYDVFLYNNSGTLTLELSAAWTNDTTRANAVTRQNGVWVKSGATTRRLLGSIRASGTDTTEDSLAKRFVWNVENRRPRVIQRIETDGSWTYSTDTYRQANGAVDNQVEILRGLDEDAIDIHIVSSATHSGGAMTPTIGIGVDSTSSKSPLSASDEPTQADASEVVTCQAHFHAYATLGYHKFVWLEKASAGSTTTWNGVNRGSSGMTGVTHA